MKIIVAALGLCALSSQVQADCTCQCVNGQMQPLCSSALDIAPPCIGICGPVAPSIAPINPPTIPPLGTVPDGDSMGEIVDRSTGAYEIFRAVERFGPNSEPIFIIDEYDRVQDSTTHVKMADTIKYLSDYSAKATVIIVGVARDVKGHRHSLPPSRLA